MDRVGTIVVRRGRGIVIAVAIEIVGGEKAVGVVNGDRPKGVHRHVTDRDHIGRFTVVHVDGSDDAFGHRGRLPSPARDPDQVAKRVYLAASAEGLAGLKADYRSKVVDRLPR